MAMSECIDCGFRIPTEELLARFRAGLGKCPECNRTGRNLRQTAGGLLYVADGNFRKVIPESRLSVNL